MANSSVRVAIDRVSLTALLVSTTRLVELIGLLLLTSILLIRSTASFNASFDYLWYHLPNALLWFGNNTFVPSSFVRQMKVAQPPLGEIVQGLLVYATGKIQLANSHNFFALVSSYFAIVIAYRRAKLPIDAVDFGLALLAIPLVVIHASSGYIDLFGNCGILLAYSALPLVRLKDHYFLGSIFVYVGLLAACLSRYNLWPTAGLLLFAYMSVSWKYQTEIPLLKRATAVVVLGVLLAAWPIKNTVLYGNPTFPYRPPLVGTIVTNYTEDSSAKVLTQAPERYRQIAHATLFAISALELNRVLSPEEPFHWSVDMGFDPGVASPHFRLGGWNWVTMIVFLTIFCSSIFRLSGFSIEALFLIAATVSVAILPQSHELRYFLFIPMGLALYCSRYVPTLSSGAHLIYRFALLVALVTSIAGTGGLDVWLTKPELFAAPEARAAWDAYLNSDRSRPLCVREDRYDGILWSGPRLLEFPVKAQPVCHGIFADRN